MKHTGPEPGSGPKPTLDHAKQGRTHFTIPTLTLDATDLKLSASQGRGRELAPGDFTENWMTAVVGGLGAIKYKIEA